VQGPLNLTDKNRPSAGRAYIGGTQAIPLATPFVGNLYAPRALVGSTPLLEVWGSIFAGGFQCGSPAIFVFDRDIINAGNDCTAPTPPSGLCTQCEWCYGGAACVDGVCTACRSDSDCCGQAICANGRCEPLVSIQ
jgi:hypothetical protein